MIDKYIGRDVEIIYQDGKGSITQRQIRVHAVKDGKVRAYCKTAKAFRVFSLASILAVQPVARRAG